MISSTPPNNRFNKLPPVRRKMTVSERKGLANIIGGKQDINTNKSQKLLDKPHVAIAFEAILDGSGLTDHKLARKLNEIIKRRNVVITADGKEIVVKGGKQQTSIDANALTGIRMAWQAKGKFTEKHEHKIPGMSGLSEEQLDKIIASGIEYIHLRKNTIEGKEEGGDGTTEDSNDANTDNTSKRSKGSTS